MVMVRGTRIVGRPKLPDDFNVQLEPPSRGVIEVCRFVEADLLRRVLGDPEIMRTMGRRAFEELVAELWDGFGYEVELTRRTRDGGADVIALRKKEAEVRFLIECKRPDPGNPIGVGIVRELLGAKQDRGASHAILATTTRFTKDAQEFQERNRWDLGLRDFEGVKEWLEQYGAKPRDG
jgi:restriction system protein